MTYDCVWALWLMTVYDLWLCIWPCIMTYDWSQYKVRHGRQKLKFHYNYWACFKVCYVIESDTFCRKIELWLEAISVFWRNRSNWCVLKYAVESKVTYDVESWNFNINNACVLQAAVEYKMRYGNKKLKFRCK